MFYKLIWIYVLFDYQKDKDKKKKEFCKECNIFEFYRNSVERFYLILNIL